MPATGTMVELLLGPAWTDITDRVYHRDRIKITRGRQDEGATVQPSSCTLTLNNHDGRFSPRNPLGPYFGQIGRNTPLRVSVAAGSAFLRATDDTEPERRVSTPSTAALNITGDMDLRFDVQPADWNTTRIVEVAGKWGAAGQRAWFLRLFAGTVRFGFTTDGTTQQEAFASHDSVVHPRRMCLRVTVDVNNGAGGRTVQFFSGPTLAGPWTHIGADNVFAGTTATATSTAPLEVGDVTATSTANAACRIYAFEMRSGIGGTVVAAPDFTALAPGTTSFTDSAGVPWTANSTSAITNRRVRFVGEVSEWPSRWDPAGSDVHVQVQAAGIMRRLGQGVSPLDSTLRRRVPSDPNLIAYWPMEDGSNATQAYSPLPGVRSMTLSGVQMASDDTLAGSLALPQWSPPTSLHGSVPTIAPGDWRVELVYKLDTLPTTLQGFMKVNLDGAGSSGSPVAAVRVSVSTTQIQIGAYDPADSLVAHAEFTPNDFTDGWGRLQIYTSTSGSTVTLRAQWIVIGAPTNWFVQTTFSGGPGRPTSVGTVWGSDFSTLRMGHVAVFESSTSSIFDNADKGFDGETVDARMTRLAVEEGVPLLTPYGVAGTELVGPQRAGTLVDLLQEAATADVGILYEARGQVALAARPRQSLYNQTATLALDYAARGEVAPPLEPQEDDQATRNDVTRSRPNGSSARVTLDVGPLSTQAPPLGVGRYQDSQTVNVHSDNQLPDQAGWWLHLGTWDEARYPQVTVNLAAGPWLAEAAAEVDLGDLITIDNPPPWLAPGLIRLLAQGYTETIGWADWTIAYNCTPGGPWVVGVRDDAVLGRRDTGGSQLAAAVTSTATVLSVATTSGPLWTTDPADYPLDLAVGGEVVTARAAGVVLDLVDGTFESGVTGWTPTGGTFVPSADARTGTGAGLLTVTGTPTQTFVRPDTAHYIPATAGTEYRCTVWVKASAAVSAMAAIDWRDASSAAISTSSGASTSLTAGVWTPLTVTATAPATTAFVRPGPTITGSPAAGTQLVVDDVATVATSSYTNSPQSMTVTRAVNGITKAQSAGTAVRLAQPTTRAL